MDKKLTKSKTEKSLSSLMAIVIVLTSMLAFSIAYERNKMENGITAKVTGLKSVSGFK